MLLSAGGGEREESEHDEWSPVVEHCWRKKESGLSKLLGVKGVGRRSEWSVDDDGGCDLRGRGESEKKEEREEEEERGRKVEMELVVVREEGVPSIQRSV